MVQTVAIFDIDGTLTRSRRPMEAGFARIFRGVARAFPCYLVTGSDHAKVAEQIPADVLAMMAGVFTCAGNELWQGGRTVFSMHHAFPDEMIDFVESLVADAGYPVRTGRHVEERVGTLNVSVVGRNANALQRKDYLRHDRATGERQSLIEAIRARFPDYDAFRGGQISIDISPKGWNKARVAGEVTGRHEDAEIHFFADNINADGNDLPLARALENSGRPHRIHPVRNCDETLAILKSEYCRPARPAEAAGAVQDCFQPDRIGFVPPHARFTGSRRWRCRG